MTRIELTHDIKRGFSNGYPSVIVRFDPNDKHFDKDTLDWLPTHQEIFDILRLMADFEDMRYPPPLKGRVMLFEKIIEVLNMGTRLDEIMEKKQEKTSEEIQVFLDEKETKKILYLGKKKIENCAWVIKNSKDEKAIDNAKKSAEFWEKLLDKIESQLGG